MSTVLQLRPVNPEPVILECTKCSQQREAGCNCGVDYRVRPIERAQTAIEANPDMSDRAIAEEIGVGKDTVRRARKATGADAPVEKRTGRDGKKRALRRAGGGRARLKAPRKRTGPVVIEAQHERDLRALMSFWNMACETARKAFLQTINDQGDENGQVAKL